MKKKCKKRWISNHYQKQVILKTQARKRKFLKVSTTTPTISSAT